MLMSIILKFVLIIGAFGISSIVFVFGENIFTIIIWLASSFGILFWINKNFLGYK
tara:strand:- start:106 stop:270 length:165 start_codon:yes stop_codon:yes gene_type:complete